MKIRKIVLVLLLSFLLAGYSPGQGSGSTDKGYEKINLLLKELEKTGEGSGRVDILIKIAREYLRSEPGKALDYAKQGIKLSDKIDYQKGLADCLHLSGIVNYYKRNYSRALQDYNKSLNIRERIGDKKGISDSCNNIGAVYAVQADHNGALPYLLKSLRIKEELGDKKGISVSSHVICYIYFSQGDYTRALEYALKSLKSSEEIGDKPGIARSCNMIGQIYLSEQDNHTRALEYYSKSLKIFKELGAKKDISQLYNNIGDVHTKLGNHSRALEYHLKSLHIREEIGDKGGISDSQNNIGNIYKILGNHNRALDYQLKSLRIREELGDKGKISGSYHSIAIIYNEQGMPEKSLGYLLKGLKLVEEKNAKEYMLVFLKDLSATYAALKNYQEAFQYHRRYSDLKESIFNTEKTREITRIRTRYEVEKKEAENESLKQKNKIQELSLGKRKNLITAFIFISGLMFILVFVTYNRYRLKKKSNIIIQAEKEKVVQANLAKSRLLAELEEKSEKLKEMDRIKCRFFANISHEFRTPLTLIMGPLEQVLSDYHGEDYQRLREVIKMALGNSQRLLVLINQLLDLSKLESGKMQLQTSRQNIIPFLKGLVGSFESLAVREKLDLVFIAREEDITFSFDPEKLEKVIVNLLANAVKFTPAGGKITVTAAANTAKEEMEITVSDTGNGIPENQLPYIFDRFYQAEGYFSHEYKHKGTGIGLALAKELVTLHRGDICVASREGKGTEFTIRLPLVWCQPSKNSKPTARRAMKSFSGGQGAPRRGEPIRGGIVNEDVFNSTIFARNLHLPPLAEKAPLAAEGGEEKEEGHIEAGADGKDVILVVEDNPDMRKYIRGSLEAEYTVIEAADGEEGGEKARDIIPDLIISDVMMPRKDGYQLCGQLKKDVRTSHIPIVLLTAKASEASVVEGLETGADDYITKPFNTKILLVRIKNLIDLRRLLQETVQREMMLQPTKIAVSSIDREFMKELKEAIEKNIGDMEFGVDELAKALYMSRTSLNRKVKALTGDSPNRFIQSYRLKRAAQLLKARFGNVTEVAFEVGFSSSNYFTRCFKEKFHRLPHTYSAD